MQEKCKINVICVFFLKRMKFQIFVDGKKREAFEENLGVYYKIVKMITIL
jgi:hypothetical protein